MGRLSQTPQTQPLLVPDSVKCCRAGNAAASAWHIRAAYPSSGDGESIISVGEVLCVVSPCSSDPGCIGFPAVSSRCVTLLRELCRSFTNFSRSAPVHAKKGCTATSMQLWVATRLCLFEHISRSGHLDIRYFGETNGHTGICSRVCTPAKYVWLICEPILNQ